LALLGTGPRRTVQGPFRGGYGMRGPSVRFIDPLATRLRFVASLPNPMPATLAINPSPSGLTSGIPRMPQRIHCAPG
jgi:hypothetical protein